MSRNNPKVNALSALLDNSDYVKVEDFSKAFTFLSDVIQQVKDYGDTKAVDTLNRLQTQLDTLESGYKTRLGNTNADLGTKATKDEVKKLSNQLSQLTDQIQEVYDNVDIQIAAIKLPTSEETADGLSTIKREWIPIEAIKGNKDLIKKDQFGKYEQAIIEIGGKLTVLEKRTSKGYGALGGGSEGTGALFLSRLRDVDLSGLTLINGKYRLGSGTGGGITVQDIDGSPTVTNVTAIKFTNGAVTDNGDGTVNVSTSGAGGGGDVSSNTATAVDSEVALFSGTGGKTIKRATGTGIAKLTSGVLGTATAGTDYTTPSSTETVTNKNLTSGTNTFPTFNQNTTGNAATVTTNANLTGPVTSVGNTTSIAAGAITNTMLANGAVANLSGTNSGDETTATIKTKLGITTLSGSNTGDQTITLTGDATGSGTGSFAVNVGKINGTALSGLSTGILKNTTTTGVPSIAAAGTDYQAPISLTTTGTSGAATLISNTLNIPQYSAGGGGDASTNTSTSVDGEVTLFSGTAGKTLKRATGTGLAKLTSGVLGTATSGTDYSAGTSALSTGILKSTTATGALTIATGADLPTMTSTVGGAVPTPPNNTTTFLRGDGTFATPSGSGDMLLASAQTNSGTKTFLDTTFKLRNVANTFNGSFVNTNTADRIYTLKDAAGTLAFTSDITGTNSGTNTGDQTITLTGAVTGSGTGSFATTIATPGTLTVASTNSTATAHTHAITSSSAPGAAASLLATDASGIIGSTGTRIVKGWFTDLAVTNAIAGSITGNAATVTTNANLTGVITSSGNATSIASQTGTGTKFVVDNTPTLLTPVFSGLPTGTGVASAATASTLAARDANANLAAANHLEGYATTVTAAGTTTLTVASNYQQYFTGTTTQTVVLPVASTLVLGQQFQITNLSTGVVTIQSSGANTVLALPAASTAIVTCILTSGTTAASWSVASFTNTPSTATGTVTAVSVATANGFAGTSSGGATPALTLSTSITGLLKGNGTAISAASSSTDYQVPITLTTTGTSGAATFSAGTLNIPQYAGGGSGTTKSIAQTSHGFSVGQIVRLSGTSTYATAKADSAANAEVVGIVSTVTDANNFILTTEGYVTGLSSLTANTTYFLDPVTAGALTATAPTTSGQVRLPLFVSDTTTSGYFHKYEGIVVSPTTTAQFVAINSGTTGQYASSAYTLTDTTTIALDWNNGNVQKVTLGGNRTITFANPIAGARYLLEIIQDGTGSRTVTLPTIKWQGGTAPTLTTTASKTDLITLVYDGTSYFGQASLNF